MKFHTDDMIEKSIEFILDFLATTEKELSISTTSLSLLLMSSSASIKMDMHIGYISNQGYFKHIGMSKHIFAKYNLRYPP